MENIKHISLVLAALRILALGPYATEMLAQDSQARVRIELREVATVDRPLVQIQDVARVEGGSPQVAEQIRGLDLHELRPGEKVTLQTSHVRIRLLLAGFAAQDFQITEKRSVLVSWIQDSNSSLFPARNPRQERILASDQTTDATSLEALQAGISIEIRRKVSEVFSIQPDAVVIQLDGRVNEKQLREIADSGIRFPRFELLDNGRQALGPRRLRVAVIDNQIRKLIANIYADTSMIVRTPVAKLSIAAGDVFSAENVAFQAGEIRNPAADLLTETSLLGKTSNRRIALGAEIPASAINNRSVRGIQEQQQLIKSQDPVRVVARVGKVSVRLSNATALQAGKLGDAIRVRNDDSQKTLTCRVLAAHEVEAIVR